MYDLTVSFHKGTCASSHLGHNNRTVYVPHADPSRKDLNVCYIDMSLEEAYHFFDDALAQYNKGKKPCRQIKDYYQHILKQYQKGQEELQRAISSGASKAEQRRIKSKYPKLYYEVIVSIGSSDCYDGAFSVLGEKSELTAKILNRYMEDFQRRNPHLYVFSAHMHRDETGFRKNDNQDKNNSSKAGIPHLHLCYIPWTDLPGRGLPVRVSENGAFTQQGLTTGKLGDYGTVRFQEQERQVLTEISKEYGINIVAGRHSKKHLSKEEYILKQEQERTKVDFEQIDQEASALLDEQDKFIEFVQNSNQAISYLEHIENVELRQTVSELNAVKQRSDQLIANAWDEFNSATASYFKEYREKKKLLYDEIYRARQGVRDSRKHLNRLLNDIAYSNDFFIIKLFKLLCALFIAVNNIHYDNQVERLQEANTALKQQAKEIMQYSNDVSAALRTKEIDNIEKVLSDYEAVLDEAKSFVLHPSERIESAHSSEHNR